MGTAMTLLEPKGLHLFISAQHNLKKRRPFTHLRKGALLYMKAIKRRTKIDKIETVSMWNIKR